MVQYYLCSYEENTVTANYAEHNLATFSQEPFAANPPATNNGKAMEASQ